MPDSSSNNWTTSVTAGSSALIAGAITKIVLAIIKHTNPWFLDDTTAGAIDTLITAACAFGFTKLAHNLTNKPVQP